MIDLTKIDEEVRYLDLEPKKKGGGYWWLVLLAPGFVALVVLLVGSVLKAKVLLP